MIAYCGLDCSKCLAFNATQANDDKLREDCARRWTRMFKHEILPAQINCDGCKVEGRHFFHCEVCGIRACASGRGLDNCGHCADFGCEKIEGLMQMDPNIRKALEAQRGKAGA